MIGLSLLLTLGSILIGWAFEVITPKAKSIFREEYISVVVKLNPAQTSKAVIRTETESITLKLEKDKEIYCKTVKIIPGKNRIAVEITGKDGKVQLKVIPVFMASQVFPAGNTPPKDFKVSGFHKGKSEALCAECHKSKSNTAVGAESCKQCHGNILNRKFPHPPSVAGCTLCHTGGERSKYAWKEPISDTCFMCHGDKKNIWYSKKYMHGPPSTGRCYICHNPHSEDVRFFLKKQTNDLCTTCHSEKREEKHPLVGFVFGDAHPVSGKPDPARPGFELACTGCHNPHASNYRFFFQNDYSGEAILCLRCHKK